MDCSAIICIIMFVLLIAAVLIFVNIPTITTVIKQRGGVITWHDRLLTTEPEDGTGMDKHLKYISYNAIPTSRGRARERRRVLVPSHEYSRDITVLNSVLGSRLSYEQQLIKSMGQPATFEPDMVIEPGLNRRLLVEFDEGNDFHDPSTDLRYAAKQQEYYSHILSDRNDMMLLRITYRKGLHASENDGPFRLDGTGMGDKAIRAIIEYIVPNFNRIHGSMRRSLVLARLRIRGDRLTSVDICSFTKDELSTLLRAAYRSDNSIIPMDELFTRQLRNAGRSDFYVTINESNVTVTMNESARAHGGANRPIADLKGFIATNIDPYVHDILFYGRNLSAAKMNGLLTEKDIKDIMDITDAIIDRHLMLHDLLALYDPYTSRYESYWSISDYKEKIANDTYINNYKQLKNSIANSSGYSHNAKTFILSVLLIREYAAYTDDWWYGPKHPEDDLRDWFTYTDRGQTLCDLPWILDVKGNLKRYNQYLVPYVYELWDTVAEKISTDEWYSCRTKK